MTARLSIRAAEANTKAVERLIDKLHEPVKVGEQRHPGATEAALARRLDDDPALAAWVREFGHVPGRTQTWEDVPR